MRKPSHIISVVYLLKTWRVFGKREIIDMLLIIQLVHACTCPCCFTSVSDGFSFHGAKVRKKNDTRKREGDFLRGRPNTILNHKGTIISANWTKRTPRLLAEKGTY